MAQTPEGKIKKALDKTLQAEGVWAYSPQAGPFGSAGIPDRVAIVNGRFVGVGCKANKSRKPTALQTAIMARIENAGGKCFVVYDQATIEEVREFIDASNRESKGVTT